MRFSSGVLLVLLTGCDSSLEPPNRRSDVAGTITQVQQTPAFRVFIERDPGQAGSGEKVWFTVTDGTEILVRQPDASWLKGSRSALGVGVRATGWADHPITGTYPAEATAEHIIVFP
jgi:hypothetical protein